jgi:hypothetical protein
MPSIYLARRSIEAVPEYIACRWLNKCRGADLVRERWLEADLWCPPLYRALDLPRFGKGYPCDGCPIVASHEEVAA